MSQEEVAMADTKKIAEEGKRLGQETAEQAQRFGQEAQDQARRIGQEYQAAVQSDFESASQSLGEVNKGFQAIAAEMTEYSKKTFEDVFYAWEQLLRARTFEDVIHIQTRYAQKAYDAHVSEMSRLTELYRDLTRNAVKPIEQTSKRFT
jgi:phasin family protein